MRPKKLAPLSLAVLVVGSLTGERHGPDLPHLRPSIVMVDGTGKPGIVAVSSNTLTGWYAGDGIVRTNRL